MANITAWVKKVWKDRKTEYPTRRTLTKTNGSQEIVTVARNEGNVSQEGDAFSAANMNDLEERIDAGFTELTGNLGAIGKKLWTGSFTSGTITVSGLSKYVVFVVRVGGVVCIGNINYGAGGYVTYGGHAISTNGYRFTADVSKETLTIDSVNTGGSDGSKNVEVTAIYGLL